MRRIAILVCLLVGVLAAPAAAQLPGDLKDEELVQIKHLDMKDVADTLGGDCESTKAKDFEATKDADVKCKDGKVEKITQKVDKTEYRKAKEAPGHEGELDPDFKYVAVTEFALGSRTGCHNPDPLVLQSWPIAPGYADTSQSYLFQKYDASDLETDNYRVNYNSFATSPPSILVNMNGGTNFHATTAYLQGGFELTGRDWKGLRNSWCDYGQFPGNGGWYQGLGDINPSSQSHATSAGWGGGLQGSTSGESSLLQSCYRGKATEDGLTGTDGQNVVMAAAPTSNSSCNATTTDWIGVTTTVWGVPNDNIMTCPNPLCKLRIIEWDMVVRKGRTASSARQVAFCMESQPAWCNSTYSNGFLQIYSFEELLRHEFGHTKGIFHESGNTTGDLMGPYINELGAAAPDGNTDRIGCNEAKYMHWYHKPHNTADDPYPIFPGGANPVQC